MIFLLTSSLGLYSKFSTDLLVPVKSSLAYLRRILTSFVISRAARFACAMRRSFAYVAYWCAFDPAVISIACMICNNENVPS